MTRVSKIPVKHKSRRLVERAIRLHVEKATTYFYASQTTSLAQSNAARNALARRAQIAKRVLLEYIAALEKR